MLYSGKKFIIPVMVVLIFGCFFAGEAKSSEGLYGKQFFVLGLSTGDIPFYSDVFSFGENGSFTMEKLAAYGSGDFYEIVPGLFCFSFTLRPGMDVQYVDAFGFYVGSLILGFGYFMIDYEVAPMFFIGAAVYQALAGG